MRVKTVTEKILIRIDKNRKDKLQIRSIALKINMAELIRMALDQQEIDFNSILKGKKLKRKNILNSLWPNL